MQSRRDPRGSHALISLAAIAAAMACGTAQAGTVTIRADQAAVNTLTKNTYGSGFDYFNAYIRSMFTDKWGSPPQPYPSANYAQPSYDIITKPGTGYNFGMIRYPGGDPSFYYRWDNTCGSVVTFGPSGCTEHLTLDDIRKYITAKTVIDTNARAPLGAAAIFQVNTIFYWNLQQPALGANTIYRLKTGSFIEPYRDANGLYEIDPVKLDAAATYAAGWVTQNRQTVTKAEQTVYWEIGNEDWARATPQQYAQIFKAFTTKMIAANGSMAGDALRAPLKFIAQGAVENGNYIPTNPEHYGINQTAGQSWIYDFASALQADQTPLNRVHAVSVHPYVNGGTAVPLQDRIRNMFAQADATETIDYPNISGNIRGFCNITQGSGSCTADHWKIVTTEYNVKEPKGPNGAPAVRTQNKAHGLVLADWTLNLLTQGLDKVFPFGLDFSQQFGLFQYAQAAQNVGTVQTSSNFTLNQPRQMASGSVIQRLTANFLGNLHKVDTASFGTASYTDAAGTQTIKAVSAYAVLRTATPKMVNMLLVNRSSIAQTTYVRLQSPTLSFTPNLPLYMTEFAPNQALGADNFLSEVVKWGDVVESAPIQQTCSGTPRVCEITTPITVPANSMLHVQALLQ